MQGRFQRLGLLIIPIIALTLSGSYQFQSASPSSCDTTIIAHRGDSFDHPENTLDSVESGLSQGASLIEVDIVLTKDGVPVVHHDYSLERTGQSNRDIRDLTYSEVKDLDVGSWRSKDAAPANIPTLEQLLSATKGRAKYYLDIKIPDISPALLQAAHKAKFPLSDLYIPVINQQMVYDFQNLMPESPLVWFGGIPPQWNESWFHWLKQHHVVAIELHWPTIRDQAATKHFIDAAHQAQLAIWSYVINDKATLNQALKMGVDAVETDRPAALIKASCNAHAMDKEDLRRIRGNWNFSDGAFRSTVGSKLTVRKNKSTALLFGSTAQFGLPAINGKAGRIVAIPALGPNEGLLVYPGLHHFGPGNGNFINRYSLIIDLLRPVESEHRWTALLQTNEININDADLYINEDGSVGTNSLYHGHLAVNTWHRLAIVVDLTRGPNGIMEKYIDGRLVGTNTLDGIDGRWALHSNIDTLNTLLFSDDNNETAPLYVSAVQIRNYAMTPGEIQTLGHADADGISETIE